MPPISSRERRARRRAPAGIQVGFGAPCPGVLRSRRRPKRRRYRVVSELSRDCITSAITVRSDQCRTDSIGRYVNGLRASVPSHRSVRRGPPGTSAVCSRPIALEPRP